MIAETQVVRKGNSGGSNDNRVAFVCVCFLILYNFLIKLQCFRISGLKKEKKSGDEVFFFKKKKRKSLFCVLPFYPLLNRIFFLNKKKQIINGS